MRKPASLGTLFMCVDRGAITGDVVLRLTCMTCRTWHVEHVLEGVVLASHGLGPKRVMEIASGILEERALFAQGCPHAALCGRPVRRAS